MCIENVQRHKASPEISDICYPKEYILTPLCNDNK